MPSGKKTAKKAKAAKTPTKNRPAPKKKTAAPKAARTKAAKPAKAKAPPRKAAPAPKRAAKPPAPRPAAKAPAKPAAKAPAKPAKAPPKRAASAPPPQAAKAVAKAPAKPTPATTPTVKPSAAPAKRPAPVQKPAATAKAPAAAPKAPPASAPAPRPPPTPPATAAAPTKAAKSAKRKPIPTTSLAATPVIRPLGAEAPQPAPPPPPAKPGHVDHQVLSAISYGLFAAVNKTFGFAGQSVVKNAALRMLEYGYRRGWLPPKSREPVRALNEFFGRLETMGYAEKIHVAKHGEGYALEVHGLADFDAVWSLKEMHYPLLPVFLGEMLQAIADQYFGMKVTTEPLEMQEQRRGFILRFSLHERPTGTDVSRIVQYSRSDDFEE